MAEFLLAIGEVAVAIPTMIVAGIVEISSGLLESDIVRFAVATALVLLGVKFIPRMISALTSGKKK